MIESVGISNVASTLSMVRPVPTKVADQRPLCLLLLEDNDLDADLTLLHLTRSGFHLDAHRAENKQQFVELLQARTYDLILSDYALPDYDGASALALARTVSPRTPFIMLSGQLGEELAIDTLHRGATDYVLKQRIERLAPSISRALDEAEERLIRQRAEARANESEDRFQQLTDLLPEMVFTWDASGRVTYANAAWRKAIPAYITQWRDPEILHPADRDFCARTVLRAHEERAPFSLECRLLDQTDGIYHWRLVRAVPFQSSEGVQSWLGTATDLHEQKLREEAFRTAEKLAVTGRMSAAIAHEINNPLESLMNLIFLLKADTQLSEAASQYVSMAEKELERVSSIVKQTLQFYREPETVTWVDAQELFEGVVRMFVGRLRGKKIHIDVLVPHPVHFQAVAGEIRQVIVNLVANAIDAVLEDGSIQLQARLRDHAAGSADSPPRPFAELCVVDTGVGISREQAEQLFQPFFSTKGDHGTGLGLWVSKGIIEKGGGSIRLETVEQSGKKYTTAAVLLPIDKADFAREAHRS